MPGVRRADGDVECELSVGRQVGWSASCESTGSRYEVRLVHVRAVASRHALPARGTRPPLGVTGLRAPPTVAA